MRPSLSLVPSLDSDFAAALDARLDAVEARLRSVIGTSDELVSWTSRHLMDAGGKRVRPLLSLIAAGFGDLERPEVVDVAALVELTHLATLYHDDVMDDASTRRGARTAHELWGNSVAILTGDFLFARASALSADLGPDLVRVHSSTFERLCMGQLHETVGPRADEDPFAHYMGVLSDKTASLIATAAELGARVSGAPPAVGDSLREYGEKVGIAFQLADDVLDLRSDRDVSGKTPGTDLREGVSTMPVLLLRRRVAEQGADARTSELLTLLDGDLSDDADLARAVDLLRQDSALEETSALARTIAGEALDVLRQLPACPARDALEELTETLVERDG